MTDKQEMSGTEPTPTRHKIGCARTIRTTILCCQYLRERCAAPHSSIHPDSIGFVYNTPSPENGWWSADIIVTVYGEWADKESSRFVDTCRAFVAGAGEVWA